MAVYVEPGIYDTSAAAHNGVNIYRTTMCVAVRVRVSVPLCRRCNINKTVLVIFSFLQTSIRQIKVNPKNVANKDWVPKPLKLHKQRVTLRAQRK